MYILKLECFGQGSYIFLTSSVVAHVKNILICYLYFSFGEFLFFFFFLVVIIISLLIYNSLLYRNDVNLWLVEYDINIVLSFSLVF